MGIGTWYVFLCSSWVLIDLWSGYHPVLLILIVRRSFLAFVGWLVMIGPSMTQCLGLSLLSSIVATLGVDSSSGDGGGAGGGGMAGSSDDKHMKELQGLQVRWWRWR